MKTKLLISLIAVLFVSVLCLLYLNFTKKPEIINDWPILPTFTPSPIPTISDSTANWKIYTNTVNNYSLKYSNRWTIDQTKSEMVYFFPVQKPNEMLPGFSISVSQTSLNSFLANHIKSGEGVDNSQVKPENFILDGVLGKKITYASAEGGNIISYFIQNGGKSYIIDTPDFYDSVLSHDLSQILSTFKFTDTFAITPTAKPILRPTSVPVKSTPTIVTEKINNSFSCGTYSGTSYPPRPAFGANPLLVSFSPSGGTTLGISLAGFQWDYLGNGNWDTSTTNGLASFTYNQNGTFTPKFRVKGSDGSVGPTCTYPYLIIVGTSTEFSNSIIAVDKLNLNITISKSSHNYNFPGIESNLNDGGSRIFAPGFSVSSKDQFTAIRYKTAYNSLFGVYETGYDLEKGTSGVYHFFIDKNQPNGIYNGEYSITYTTNNGTVVNDGPTIKFSITLTD